VIGFAPHPDPPPEGEGGGLGFLTLALLRGKRGLNCNGNRRWTRMDADFFTTKTQRKKGFLWISLALAVSPGHLNNRHAAIHPRFPCSRLDCMLMTIYAE